MQKLRGALPFVAKYKRVSIGKISIPHRLFRMGRQQPATGRRRGLPVGRPVVVVMHIELMPIIHTASAHFLFRNGEAQWVNQMQPALGNGTHSANVASILGNLWLVQNDVQHEKQNDIETCLVNTKMLNRSAYTQFAVRQEKPCARSLAKNGPR